tara:strand:+ start:363 stop:779 length:417 start_codon:yes stop_codon:yes gene_type:complete
MIVYLDENMPKHLAEGFHILQYPEGLKQNIEIEVKYIPTEFGKGCKDEDWLPKVGKQKACVLTQDYNIHRRKHEMELYKKHNLGMFFLRPLSKKRGLSIWQMVETLAKRWPEISRLMQEEKKPFGYEILLSGKMKKIV